jgi:HEAT repeat protein
MATVHPEELHEVIPCLLAGLEDSDPQARGLSAWALGNLREQEATEPLKKLLDDEHPLELYDRGELRRTTVAQLAREALTALK